MEEEKAGLKVDSSKVVIVGPSEEVKGGRRDVGGDVDRGWAWVVCAACFVVHLLFSGQVASSTIYFVTFVQAFEQSRSSTSWIFGALNSAVCITGPIAALCLRKWGPRWVVIGGSLLMGISMVACYFATSTIYLTVFFALSGVGGSCLFTSGVATPALYFKKYLFVATGIAISGSGLGIIVMGPLLEWAIEAYGWRGALLLQGGLMLQGVVCGALMFSPRKRNALLKPDNNNRKQEDERGPPRPTPSRVLFKDVRTWLIIICMFQHFLNFTSFILCLKDYVIEERHISTSFSMVAVVVGLCNTLGRVASGFISKLITPSVLFSFASFMASGAIAMLILAYDDWSVVCCVGVASIGFGMQAVLMNLMTASIFGGTDMATVFSYGMFGSIAGILGAPSFLGYMKDVTGSYNIPLAVMVGGMTLAGFSSLLAYVLHKQVLIKKQQKSVVEVELIHSSQINSD